MKNELDTIRNLLKDREDKSYEAINLLLDLLEKLEGRVKKVEDDIGFME